MLSSIKLPPKDPDAVSSISDNASDFREKTGAIIRQLAFAGIAIVWLFKSGDSTSTLVPQDLAMPLLLLALTLALDLFENANGALIWSIKPSRIIEASKKKPWWFALMFSLDQVPGGAPNLVSWPVRFVFWLKLVVLLVAYAQLLTEIAPRAGPV